MNDHELDRALVAASPISDAELHRLLASTPMPDVSAEISAGGAGVVAVAPRRADGHRVAAGRAKARWTRAAAAVAAAVLVFAVTTAALSSGGSDRAWAAPLVRFADGSPRLLLDGFRVEDADEYGEGEGEMTFAEGDRRVELFWRRTSAAELAADRERVAVSAAMLEVLGATASVTRYPGSSTFAGVWDDGGRAVEVRMDAASTDEVADVLAGLHRVDIDTWLSAMPERVVTKGATRETVDEMLDGVPLPPGFDTGALARSMGLHNRYQLGAEAVGAVGCAWLRSWADALDRGDGPAADRAAAAMASASEWKVLREMDAEGDFPEVVWGLAPRLRSGASTRAAVESQFADTLGCSPR